MTVIVHHQNTMESSMSNLSLMMTALRCTRASLTSFKGLRCSLGEFCVIKPANPLLLALQFKRLCDVLSMLREVGLFVPGCTCLCKWPLGGLPIRRSAWAAAQSACTAALGVPPPPCADDSPSCECPHSSVRLLLSMTTNLHQPSLIARHH